jgi:hypothetical protein
MNLSATIKLFLPFGDPKNIRIAEISNWSGKAVGAPRSDLDHFLRRPELAKPGVYVLSGVDPVDGEPIAYVGEAEVVSERIKQHKNKDYWNSVIAFISKDENLTRAHIRYLEGRLIKLAETIGRYKIANTSPSGAHLPESDQHDMEVFLERIGQLLPVLGSELLSPIAPSSKGAPEPAVLYCRMKGAAARGLRSPNGFVILKGSTAVAEARQSAKAQGSWILTLREKLRQEGALAEDGELLVFTREVEFASPSAAAAVVYGGTAPGPIAWKDSNGKTLKDIESIS